MIIYKTIRFNSLLPFLLLSFLLNSIAANGAEMARFYDVSHYQSSHDELGLHRTVGPMTMLYEGNCWKNGKNLASSRATRTLPDNEVKILKSLRRAVESPVLIDWESLPSGHFQRLSDEEVVSRRNWYLTCMKHVRQLADENDCGDRAWGMYGGVPHCGADPRKEREGLTKSLTLWLNTKPNLLTLIDFSCVDQSLRYEVEGDWEDYEFRCERQSSLARLLPVPTYAMVKSKHHAVNSSKTHANAELSMQGALEHLRIPLKYYDGAIFWVSDSDKYGGPKSDRTRIGMLLAMDRLAQQDNTVP